MHIIKFTSEEIELFKKLIGMTFVSYEAEKDIFEFNHAFGKIRFNFNGLSFELICSEGKIFPFEGAYDCLWEFRAKEVLQSISFEPCTETKTMVMPVNEIVTGVSIIEDTICVNCTEEDGEYAFDEIYDSAVIFYTDKNTYMFSRTGERDIINMRFHDDIDKAYSIETVKWEWMLYYKGTFTLERRKIDL